MATRKPKAAAAAASEATAGAASDATVTVPALETEVANRLLDPFEQTFNGLLRTNDPLLLERGNSSAVWDIYRDLIRDGKVFAAFQKRMLALISKPVTVEPVAGGDAGQADADLVHDALKQCCFDQVCRDLQQQALLSGWAVSEIVWGKRNGYIVPVRIVPRAQRRFVYVQEDENQPPQLRLLTKKNMLTGEVLPERKFIVHRINAVDDNPYGTGLGLQLYWAVFFKRKGLIGWNKLNDRLGVPTPWGKHSPNAGPTEKATLFAALKAISNDGVVMTPNSTVIEMLEAKLTGSVTTHESLVHAMNDWIAEVVLSQDPHSKGGGAMAAAAKERGDVRNDLVQADSDLLSDTLNSTLIRWICEINGLAPCLVSRVVKEESDLKAASETDVNVSKLGFKPTLDSIRAKYGEGWDEATPPSPTPPPAPPALPGPKPPAGGSGTGNDPGAQFSEGDLQAGQQAIDDALAAVSDAEFRDALAGMLEPLMAAVEAASSFEDALAQAEAAYPAMDSVKLQSLLARAMFGAETFARVTDG